MSAAEPALTFVLYSEDRADADRDFAVIRELLLGMLRHICPELKTNHIRIEPTQPIRSERVCGSFWKTTPGAAPGAQELRRRLIRDVATALRLGRLVFFHVDADDVWAARSRCANACRHWPAFTKDVRTVLSHVGSRLDAGETEHALILVMPFWEIESWAFANVVRLREILLTPDDLAALAKWEHNLAALDEIEDIKDKLSIRDSRTLELVQRKHDFPSAALIEADKSYAEVVKQLRRSPPVARGLADSVARDF